MKVYFSDIRWDQTENGAVPVDAVDLPETCVLDVPEGFDGLEEGADALSDAFGYCVFSYNHEPATDAQILESICRKLQPVALELGLAELQFIEIKGTVYFFPRLPVRT